MTLIWATSKAKLIKDIKCSRVVDERHNVLWAYECHFANIGLKMVAVGLNLSPFCRRYKNVIHSLVAINTKEIIEL